jgi:inhibitor of KinA
LEPIISIFPLGDTAITLDLGQFMDEGLNKQALGLGDWLKSHSFPGFREVLVAYSSVSVFYDPDLIRARLSAGETVFDFVRKRLELAWGEVTGTDHAREGSLIYAGGGLPDPIGIPVCYEEGFAPDLEETARMKGLSIQELIDIHCQEVYRVYMIGFLPGFPYMGRTDDRIQVPRKERPVAVEAGGVGIAGNQTGIYTLDSPGGWRIIGRTPVQLFDPGTNPPVRLMAGDRVRFFAIGASDFRNWRGHDVIG